MDALPSSARNPHHGVGLKVEVVVVVVLVVVEGVLVAVEPRRTCDVMAP